MMILCTSACILSSFFPLILHIADACIIIITASESVSPTPHTGLEQTMSSADEDVLDQNE
jgi:hypothetical protein